MMVVQFVEWITHLVSTESAWVNYSQCRPSDHVCQVLQHVGGQGFTRLRELLHTTLTDDRPQAWTRCLPLLPCLLALQAFTYSLEAGVEAM
jgi:hypothetical protein